MPCRGCTAAAALPSVEWEIETMAATSPVHHCAFQAQSLHMKRTWGRAARTSYYMYVETLPSYILVVPIGLLCSIYSV